MHVRSAAAGLACLLLVGAATTASGGTASAATRAPASTQATSTSRVAVSADVAEARRQAVEDAAATSSAGTWGGSVADAGCYGTAHTDAQQGGLLDAASYGMYNGCVDPGAWLFEVVTYDSWSPSALQGLDLYADTDGNGSNGCGGFDRNVFGAWSTSQGRLAAVLFKIVDCDTFTPVKAEDIQQPDPKRVGLLFPNSDLGNPSSLRWFGDIVATGETEAEDVPKTGTWPESGYDTSATGPCVPASRGTYVVRGRAVTAEQLRDAGPGEVDTSSGVTSFRGDPAAVQAALDRLAPGAVVQADPVLRAFDTPDDPLLPTQWDLPAVNAPTAWDSTHGSSSVQVAVLDTGVDATHPELQGKLGPGYDAVASTALAGGNTDQQGHGTATAGEVAARTGNGSGLASLGRDTTVLPVKVLGADGSGTSSDVARGIRWAADHGARVLNLSLGSCERSSAVADAVTYAQGKGALVVAAAGNEAEDGNPLEYPAALPGVVAVGAVGHDLNHAVYSNTGPHVALVAPGGTGGPDEADDVLLLAPGGGTVREAGTSFAAPIVSAAAALVLALQPRLSGEQVGQLLRSTARDLGTAGRDDVYGAGLLDAAAAVGGAAAAAAATPTAAAPALALSPSSSDAAAAVTVTARTSPGAAVRLYAYSSPSTVFTTVRQGYADSTGRAAFSVAPSTTTHLYATASSANGFVVKGKEVVLSVRTKVTAVASRTAALTYRFSGRTVPGRQGTTVTLYSRSSSGALTPLASTKTVAGGGWALSRRFGKAATLTVVARAGATTTNVVGTSAPLRLAVR